MLFVFTLRQIGTKRRCEHGIFKAGAGVAADGKATHTPLRACLVFDIDSRNGLQFGFASGRNRLASLVWTTLRNEK